MKKNYSKISFLNSTKLSATIRFLFIVLFISLFGNVMSAQNGPNCPSLCFGPGGPITAGSLTISSNTFYSSLTVNNKGTLTVKSGFTLYVGQVGTLASTQVVDFQNGSTVVVEAGASLVVNGRLNNSNNSDSVTFNGSVFVTGNVTAGNGSTITGSGSLDSTGSVTGAGTIFGSENDCAGSCSFSGCSSRPSAPTGSSTQSFCSASNPTVANLAPSGTTIRWYLNALGGATIATSTNLVNGNTYYASQTTGGCESGSRLAVTVTVNTTAAPTASAQAFCLGSTVSNLAATGTALRWYTTSTGGTALSSTTALATGTYFVSQTLNSCESTRTSVAVTVNTTAAPNVGTITPHTCAIPTGNVVLSGLTVSGTLVQTGTVDANYNITASTMTITGLAAGSYYFEVLNGTCESVKSSVVTIDGLKTTTWNGSGWDNGKPISTNSQNNIIFAANYTSDGNLEGCDCSVNAGVKVTVKSNHALKITNAVKLNTAAGTSLTFENNASLVQINDVANSGNIIFERETAPIKKYDYTYWSSPVLNQKLIDVSPDTDYDKFYSFDAVVDDWRQENPQDFMQRGIGYIIRAPENIAPPPTPPGLYRASFVGVPFNGTLSITGIIQDRSYLLGNPYPSAIDADKFLIANSSVLDGTLYFWTHNTSIGIGVSNPGSGVYAYSSDDYATYNLTGGVGTGIGTGNFIGNSEQTINKPTGKIAAGQAFFTSSRLNPTGTVIDFNNSMRLDVNGAIMNNSQFFKVNNSTKKTNTIEKHRVWLNLTNRQGAFKQMLVGYLTGATNEYDSSFDGPSYNGNEFIDFYSISDGEFLAIQGRALPFDENDIVLLGYSSAIEGDFSISIDEVDGLLIGQNIYLEDKLNNTIHNLTKKAYNFETAKGTFDDRFVLRYTDKALGVGDFETTEKQVLVSVKNKQLKINSSVESIDKVFIYDVLGKQLYEKINVENKELIISNLGSSEQVLIVKTVLQNGTVITAKTIY